MQHRRTFTLLLTSFITSEVQIQSDLDLSRPFPHHFGVHLHLKTYVQDWKLEFHLLLTPYSATVTYRRHRFCSPLLLPPFTSMLC